MALCEKAQRVGKCTGKHRISLSLLETMGGGRKSKAVTAAPILQKEKRKIQKQQKISTQLKERSDQTKGTLLLLLSSEKGDGWVAMTSDKPRIVFSLGTKKFAGNLETGLEN